MIDLPSVLLFVAAASNLILGLAIFLRNTKSVTFRYYFGLTVGVATWTFTNGLFRVVPIEYTFATALFSYSGAMLTATFFALFNASFARVRILPDRLILLVGGLSAVVSAIPGVCATSVTPNREIVTIFGVKVFGIVIAGLFGVGLLSLFKSYFKLRGIQKLQIQLVSLGMSVAVAMGIICNLILPVMANNYKFVYLGPIFTLVYLISIAYAIIRTRLFDIRAVIARTAMYVMLLGTLALSFGALFIATSRYVFGPNTSASDASWPYSFMAVISLFAFQPLRRVFERLTNNIFYRDHYDSQEVLNAFSKILVSEIDLDRLLKHSLTTLCQSMHISYAQIVVFNHDRVYRVEHYGVLPKRLMVAPELIQLNQSMIIADELEGGKRKELLEHHDLRISTMLRTSEDFIGYLLIGDKLSGDVYSDQDIKVLEIISRQLAVALQNAKAFAEIKEFNVTLQGRVEHATNRLRIANRHLKELDQAKDEFISMASHQLRTPLTTIKGYLSMLSEGDAGKLTAMQNQFVGYGFDASQRMVNLISDLLNVSRLSAGRFIIQPTPTDFVKMVSDEVRQLRSHAEAKKIALIFNPPAEAWPLVDLDDNKTRQVIMNFIDNAIYYTPSGEVRILLSRTPKSVHFEVHDTGIGVPRKAQGKLFGKFFRAENAQGVRPDGTGLGLYLAKRVVEDQGGTLIFSSTEGKGSIFGFDLPAKASKPVKQGGNHGHTSKSRTRRTSR